MYKNMVVILTAIPKITAKFLEVDNVHKTPHTGIDFATNEGTKLLSAGNGIIDKIVDYGNENIGKGVFIKLDNGTTLVYGHMSNISVEIGQRIHLGDLVGLSGNTGHSTGAHLHLQAYNRSGELINPMKWADNVFDKPKFVGGYVGDIIDKIDDTINEKIQESFDKVIERIQKTVNVFSIDLLDILSIGVIGYSFYQCVKIIMLNNRSSNGGAKPGDKVFLSYFIFLLLRILTAVAKVRGGLCGK